MVKGWRALEGERHWGKLTFLPSVVLNPPRGMCVVAESTLHLLRFFFVKPNLIYTVGESLKKRWHKLEYK